MRQRFFRAAVVFLAMIPAVASADGGLIIAEESVTEVPGGTQAAAAAEGLVASSGQRAVYVARADGCWDLYIDPGAVGVSKAAWLLPLPVVPTEVAPASPVFIDELDAATQPLLITDYVTVVTTTYYHSSGSGFGCGADGAMSAGEGGETVYSDQGQQADGAVPAVTVWASGRMGSVEYGVVSAASREALEGWLGESGYVVPDGMASIVDEYVDEGAAFFVAQLSRSSSDPSQVPVFRFTLCELDDPVYPVRLSALSVDDALAFTLWIVAPYSGRTYMPVNAELGVFGSFFNSEEDAGHESDFQALYTEQRERLLDPFGLERGLAAEFSAELTEATALRRVEILGEDEDFPLADNPLEWSQELRDVLGDGSNTVQRIAGRFTTSEMAEDLIFELGDYRADPGVYARRVLEYEYDYVDEEEPSEEDDPPPAVFDDASSCRVSVQGVGDGELAIVTWLGLVCWLARRRLRTKS